MGGINAAIDQRALAAVRVFSRRARVRAAYLFGSHVHGTADEWSDIDIAVFADEVATWSLDQRVAACVEPQRLIGDDIELHLFPTAFLENPPQASFAQYVLRHGARLNLDESDL
ncbi:MAG: nucleotidyltransferase domain-containing protein [Candidatus Hydrogenedentota bacterium]